MRAPVRKELGIRTVFNILGPLTNPAGASMQLMGVYSQDMVEPMAQVLSNLGVKKGFVVCGSDGLDEVSLTGPTHVCRIKEGQLESFDIIPEDYGFAACDLSELIGGSPAENAEITRNILSGAEKGAKRDVVMLKCGPLSGGCSGKGYFRGCSSGRGDDRQWKGVRKTGSIYSGDK